MVFAVIVLSAQAPTQGAEKLNGGDRREPRFLQEIYAGVVTNQTVTFTGQGFYREFVKHWSDKERADRYSIAIHERPSARWGSLIWIEYANRKIFQIFVSPGRADIKSISEQAADVAYQNVVEADIQRLLIREPDVGPDEI
jgi:curli production assembly/transport component CsgE